MSYDLSFRKHVLAIRAREGLSIRSVAKRFGISPNTVYLWTKRLSPKPRKTGAYKVDMERLKEDVESHPDAYLYERAERLGVTKHAIFYALRRLGVTYKKNSNTSKDLRKKAAYLPVASGSS